MATLGLDLGGTNARAAVVAEDGTVLAAAKITLTRRDPDGAVEALAQAAREAISAAGVAVHGAGIGVAGQLLGESGVVAVAPNLGWRNVPFGQLLTTALGRPVRVVNDLTAAAWGELMAGAGRGARQVYVVYVGSGVGSAVIIDGRLYTGATGVAGELGHIKVEPGGRRCGCGGLGCVEAYAGGHNLIAQMRELLESTQGQGEGRALAARVAGDPQRLNPALLEELANAADPASLRLYERAASYLSLAIANQITVLNPERLILGGGVLNHAPGLKARISEAVSRWSSETSARAVRVVSAELGDDSGIIGAALLADASPRAAAATTVVHPAPAERPAHTELELLEAELRTFDAFVRGAAVRPSPPAPQTMAEQLPSVFAALAERYGDAMDVSLRREAYRDVATDPTPLLRAIADQIAHAGGGPRDVVELHARVLRARTTGVPPKKAQALMSEGRMVALELMGHLAAWYRRQAQSGGAPATGGSGVEPGEGTD